MSSAEVEEYADLFEGKIRMSNGRQKTRAKSTNNGVFITKTLHDSAGTLSKRYQKRILAKPADGFCPNVPYSMNKQQRWAKITPSSLLNSQSQSGPEIVVVNRSDVPFKDAYYPGQISDVCVVEGNAIKKLSTSGKRKPLSYFNNQIRELRHIDKKEVEPARILFNISTSASTKLNSRKKPRQTRKRCTLIEDFGYGDDVRNSFSEVQLNEDTDSETNENIRSVTLGDYLNADEGDHGFVVVPFRNKHRHKGVSSLENTDNASSNIVKETLPSPTCIADISGATNAPHIFEVINTNTKRMQPFDLEQEIQLAVPENLAVKWFGSKRVSVSSPPFAKIAFVIFFEEKENDILRVRVSTDSQFSETASRRRLLSTVRDGRRRNFADFFKDLLEFVSQTEMRKKHDEHSKDSRIAVFPEGFEADSNSKLIAPLAATSIEHDQIMYLNQNYIKHGPEGSSSLPEGRPTLCCKCLVASKDDFFASEDGVICRECISSSILRQLRLKQYPVEIPITAIPGTSPIDLLYAALPIPVMSLLIKESFAFFNRMENPHLRFVECPNCFISLVTLKHCEFNSCSCSSCGTAFCYLCKCEPHWPLSCEQFKQWSERWDTHYLYEKNYYGESDQLRLCCHCAEVYHVEEGSSRVNVCCSGVCRYDRDENGEYRHWHNYQSSKMNSPWLMKHITALGGSLKYCDECSVRIEPHNIELRRLISREFSKLCVDARKERCEGSEEFKAFLSKSFLLKKDQIEMNDLKKAVLFLVENCTAWIYLTRPDNCHELKSKVSKLHRQLLAIQRNIPVETEIFTNWMNELKTAMEELVILFRKRINIL